MDFRVATATDDMKVCDVKPSGELQVSGTRGLFPGDPGRSMIPIRMQRRDEFKMPPLGSFVVDTSMLDTVKSWIGTRGICN